MIRLLDAEFPDHILPGHFDSIAGVEARS
jgi:hypothetical protein